MNYLVVFESVHQAIRAEQILLKAGLRVELLPTPREISASCGQSLRFSADALETLLEILEQEKIVFRGSYSAHAEQRVYERLDWVKRS
ncbi:MAG: DUF3343 domain-containing protein [Negativicutes bacterium]